MSLVQGKHVLISGGGTGVGSAIARSFADAGANVTIIGRSEQPLLEVAGQLPNTRALCADVTDRESIERMLEKARAEHGPVNVTIANAGAVESTPFKRMTSEQWQQSLAVNLTGTFNLFQSTLDEMTEAGWGRLISIASTAGLKGYPYVSGYCAAKHGVIGLVKALALETAKKGITVNALCPGFVETPMLERSIENIMQKTAMSREQARSALSKDNPMGGFIQPEEVAQTALYLCTQGATSINGQAIAINGGEI